MSKLDRLRDPRALKLVLVALAGAYAVTHVIALFTDGFNWDEFVLLARAEVAARTGVLDGGGRPGLGVALLVPFVDGCTSTVDVLHQLRILWCGFTFALLAGLFVFLRSALRRTAQPWLAASLGVALLALVPVFERWSLQVRTDQPAVAAALWGGVALLASRRRAWLAVLAGALLGLGYLFSQKAVYVSLLVATVGAGDLYLDRELRWRRELVRIGGLAAGALAVLALYKLIMPRFFTPPSPVSFERGFDLLTWYRFVLRFRLYRDIVPTVGPHLVLLALTCVAAVRALRRQDATRDVLLVAVLVTVLGAAVARFHTASFPYFWITIGVFPAVAIALGWSGIVERWPRAHRVVLPLAWLVLVLVGGRYRLETLEDTQGVQRATFAFIDRALDRSLRGFHTDGGLVCRGDPDPMPAFLGQTIASRLGGAGGPRNVEKLIADFRYRPIAFLIWTARLSSFPAAVRTFWATHYVQYAHAAWLPGRTITGAAGSRHEVEILLPGRYRWIPRNFNQARLEIAAAELAPGDTVTLARGTYTAVLRGPVLGGTLVLAMDEPPVVQRAPFYDERTLLEVSGIRRVWW